MVVVITCPYSLMRVLYVGNCWVISYMCTLVLIAHKKSAYQGAFAMSFQKDTLGFLAGSGIAFELFGT